MAEKKIYGNLLYVECKPENDHFLCEAGKFDGEKIEPIQISVKSIVNYGCSGVHLILDKDSVVLKRRFEESVKDLRKISAEEILADKDLFEMIVENGTASVRAEEAYPCE